MKNKKGFTLIELLAVIVILGVIMLIAVPAVSGNITSSRKNAYLDIAHNMVNSVMQKIADGKYIVTDHNSKYYFDVTSHEFSENNLVSPFGCEFNQAYVVVEVNKAKKPIYYFKAKDCKGNTITTQHTIDELSIDDIFFESPSISLKPDVNDGNEGADILLICIEGKCKNYNEKPLEVTLVEAEQCFILEPLVDASGNITSYSISDFFADKPSCYQNMSSHDSWNTKSVTIPSRIDGKDVTRIGDHSFKDKGITEVILFQGITDIGAGAFMNNLIQSLKMPNSIKRIEEYAFYNNKIRRLTLTDGIEYIGYHAFAKNLIEYIRFPDSLKTIAGYAFYDNKLTEIIIPPSCNPSIAGVAFGKNNIPPNQAFLYKKNADGTYDYSTIIGFSGELEEYQEVYNNRTYNRKRLTIPGEKNGVQLKTIGGSAFAALGIDDVVIPDSVTKIEGTAFYNNNLIKVNWPSNLKTIGATAFRSNKLGANPDRSTVDESFTLNLPNTVTSIGAGAFKSNCIAENGGIIYSRKSNGSWDYSSIVSNGNGACGLKTLTIPAVAPDGTKLKKIIQAQESGLTDIVFPNLSDVDPSFSINVNAFYHNNLPNDKAFIYKIENATVDYSTLDSYAGNPMDVKGVIDIPGTKNGVTLTTIRASFAWKRFRTIVIPSGVTKLSANNSATSNVISKSTTNNPNFRIIVNNTDKEFDWKIVTNSSYTEWTDFSGVVHKDTSTFKYGKLRHQAGDICIVKTKAEALSCTGLRESDLSAAEKAVLH